MELVAERARHAAQVNSSYGAFELDRNRSPLSFGVLLEERFLKKV
jgi:hypothetical protein